MARRQQRHLTLPMATWNTQYCWRKKTWLKCSLEYQNLFFIFFTFHRLLPSCNTHLVMAAALSPSMSFLSPSWQSCYYNVWRLQVVGRVRVVDADVSLLFLSLSLVSHNRPQSRGRLRSLAFNLCSSSDNDEIKMTIIVFWLNWLTGNIQYNLMSEKKKENKKIGEKTFDQK